ncbi:unnamed protein product [Dovyalis caffra]|uniref:Uncharacterized protein n=1 Tax=Dovyalis caffra TaxID=77055 RepID=A0AAV1S6F4_9ROSI|nr:unnamed protein product [Dovyalis caffra]
MSQNQATDGKDMALLEIRLRKEENSSDIVQRFYCQCHILLHQHQLTLVHIQPHHQQAIRPWMIKPTSRNLFLWRPNPGVMAFGRDAALPCVAVVSWTLASEE